MRRNRSGLAMVVAVVLAAAGTPSARAQASCSQRVTADWAAARLGPGYPVVCYQEALAHLPEDVRIYSSAEDDIRRAMLAAIASRPKQAFPRAAVRQPSTARVRRPASAAGPVPALAAETASKGGRPSAQVLLAALFAAVLVLSLAAILTYRARRGRAR
jgi:hypothetical protein